MKPAPHVLVQEIEGEMVLLDAENGEYYVLDEIGTRMWQLLVEHGDMDKIVTTMLDEFEVDETTLRSDVDELLARLTAAGLIRTDGGA